MIHFDNNLAKEAFKIAHEAHELSDVANDLNRINTVLSTTPTIENLFEAQRLDNELRKKYPTIDKMLAIANNYLIPAVASQSNTQDLPEYANLKQDYFGILCDVLLKKEITTSIEQFIERVDWIVLKKVGNQLQEHISKDKLTEIIDGLHLQMVS